MRLGRLPANDEFFGNLAVTSSGCDEHRDATLTLGQDAQTWALARVFSVVSRRDLSIEHCSITDRRESLPVVGGLVRPGSGVRA